MKRHRPSLLGAIALALSTSLMPMEALADAGFQKWIRDDARRAPVATSPLMTVSGIVSHMRWVEWSWIQRRFLGVDDIGPWTGSSTSGSTGGCPTWSRTTAHWPASTTS